MAAIHATVLTFSAVKSLVIPAIYSYLIATFHRRHKPSNNIAWVRGVVSTLVQIMEDNFSKKNTKMN